ncbi:hypothetical protein LZK75_09815 [Rhizobium leguminosarum]|nr:hypothetical protein LZK75_09815 [Rhizobium leguminosarum]
MRHRGPNAEPQGALSAAMSPPPTSFESDEFGLEWSFIDDPESFVVGNADVQSSGAFLVSIDQTRPAVFEKDWNLDVSPAAITGEGINEVGEGQSLGGASDVYKDNDFLRLIRKGRQSTKQFAAVSDTRISIEYGPCRARAEEILENGYWEPGDLDELITCSRGNTNEDNLRANLMRTFESAGIRSSEGGNSPAEGLAHAWTDLDVNELALGLEATLSRATVLPGIGRFRLISIASSCCLMP